MSVSSLLDGALGSLNALIGTAKGAGSLATELFGIQRQLYDARGECLRLQDDNTALKARIVELEASLRREDAFDREQEKFQLKEVGPRSFAYAFKESAGGEECSHLLCAPCFQDRKMSILQLGVREFNVDTLKCPRCGTEVRVPNDVRADIRTARRTNRLDGF